MIIVIAGVSGVGKTTVGRSLAETLGAEFIDADDFHSVGNREKMMRGIPLTDDDRWPWLHCLRAAIDERHRTGVDLVVACSALKEAYRLVLRQENMKFVYLKVLPETIERRLRQRSGHFFGPDLLQSQLATLEEPEDALVIAAEMPVPLIVEQIIKLLRLRALPSLP